MFGIVPFWNNSAFWRVICGPYWTLQCIHPFIYESIDFTETHLQYFIFEKYINTMSNICLILEEIMLPIYDEHINAFVFIYLFFCLRDIITFFVNFYFLFFIDYNAFNDAFLMINENLNFSRRVIISRNIQSLQFFVNMLTRIVLWFW